MGENIIYMWVEKIREILTEEAEELKAAGRHNRTLNDFRREKCCTLSRTQSFFV